MVEEWICIKGDRRLILAAQGQGLRKNPIKYSIVNTSETAMCRLYGDATETVKPIVSGGKKLAQREYKKRHDRLALRVYTWKCAGSMG